MASMNAVISGFAIMDGEIKFNAHDSSIHDDKRVTQEQAMIKGIVALWSEGGYGAITMSFKQAI